MGKSDIFYMIICDRKLLGTPCIVFQHLSSGYYQFCLQCKIPLDSVLWLWNCRVKFLTIASLAIEFCVKRTYVENSWEEGNLDGSFCSASNICIVDLSFSDSCLKCSISVVWFKNICIIVCIVCIMSAGSTLCPGKPWMASVKFTAFPFTNNFLVTISRMGIWYN